LAELCSVLTVPRHREEEVIMMTEDTVAATDAVIITKENTAGITVMVMVTVVDHVRCIMKEVMPAVR
jgi:hypothetical protein